MDFVSKTATRRASGRSAEELQAAVERFLKASQKPALLEPGEEMIPLSGGNFALEARNSRLTLKPGTTGATWCGAWSIFAKVRRAGWSWLPNGSRENVVRSFF
jgi:hypothetical protein